MGWAVRTADRRKTDSRTRSFITMVLTNCTTLWMYAAGHHITGRARFGRDEGAGRHAGHAVGARPGGIPRGENPGASRGSALRPGAAGENHRHWRRSWRLPF